MNPDNVELFQFMGKDSEPSAHHCSDTKLSCRRLLSYRPLPRHVARGWTKLDDAAQHFGNTYVVFTSRADK